MNADWDFTKLPSSEYQNVVDALAAGRLWDLVAIHDKYRLSEFSYCCSNILTGVKKWFEYGIETEQIQPEANTNEDSEQAPQV